MPIQTRGGRKATYSHYNEGEEFPRVVAVEGDTCPSTYKENGVFLRDNLSENNIINVPDRQLIAMLRSAGALRSASSSAPN